MAFVRRRGDRWYGGWTDETGRRVQRALKARTKTEAQRLADELEAKAQRVRLGLDVAPGRMTFAELAAQFLKVAKARRAGTKAGLHTYQSMEGRFRRHILPAIGGKLLHQVRPSDVDTLTASLAETLSPQTRQHLRNHISAAFTYAIEKLRTHQGINPGRLASRVDIPEQAPRFLAASVIPRFLAAVPTRWRGLFATSIYTGLRKGELFGLQVGDVDPVRRLIIISRSHDSTTKSSKVRAVPIPQELMGYLAAELSQTRSVWLFPRESGAQLTPDTKLTDVVRAALKRAGLVQGWDHYCQPRKVMVGRKAGAARLDGEGAVMEARGCGYRERRADGVKARCPKCGANMRAYPVPIPLSFKDLRSTHGTHAYEATGDIRYVQRVLGHADPRLTERRYAAFANQARMLEMADRVHFLPGSALPAGEGEEGRTETIQGEVLHTER